MGISSKLISIATTIVCFMALGVGAAEAKVINGNGKDNTINGTNKADKISGRGGNDNLDGRKGADVIHGNGGKDTISDGGDLAADRLYGDAGRDFIYTTGKDRVFGGGGRDVIFTSRVRPQMLINCGAGNDRVEYNVEDEVPRTKNCEAVVFVGGGITPGRTR